MKKRNSRLSWNFLGVPVWNGWQHWPYTAPDPHAPKLKEREKFQRVKMVGGYSRTIMAKVSPDWDWKNECMVAGEKVRRQKKEERRNSIESKTVAKKLKMGELRK